MNTNTTDRMFFCKDNLEVMKGIDSEYIDLIYLDPPFNKKKVFTALLGFPPKGLLSRIYLEKKTSKMSGYRLLKKSIIPFMYFLME